MELKKRETKKIVKVQGREFEIRAFDAMTGSYIAFTILQKVLPFGDGEVTGDGLPKGREMMSKKEFIALQRDCLSVVGEVLPARVAPVLNPNGSWGVADMADNTALVLTLTIQALIFNISGFFAGDGLKDLQEGLATLIPSNTAI